MLAPRASCGQRSPKPTTRSGWRGIPLKEEPLWTKWGTSLEDLRLLKEETVYFFPLVGGEPLNHFPANLFFFSYLSDRTDQIIPGKVRESSFTRKI
jgi:hypothetical protein